MPHLYEVALSKERFTKHNNLLTLYTFFFFFWVGSVLFKCVIQAAFPAIIRVVNSWNLISLVP